MPAKAAYSSQELIERLQGALRAGAPGSAIPATGGASGIDDTGIGDPGYRGDKAAFTPENPPFCPKCGVRMVVRTARQGANRGRAFFGCPNYPRCREIIPISETAAHQILRTDR